MHGMWPQVIEGGLRYPGRPCPAGHLRVRPEAQRKNQEQLVKEVCSCFTAWVKKPWAF